jgi:hypothetical protein
MGRFNRLLGGGWSIQNRSKAMPSRLANNHYF